MDNEDMLRKAQQAALVAVMKLPKRPETHRERDLFVAGFVAGAVHGLQVAIDSIGEANL